MTSVAKVSDEISDAPSHAGWERYYREQKGARAWNGVPDAFLLEHLESVLPAGAVKVIDIASGDGRNSEPFVDRGLQVVSTDLSPSALQSFRDRCRAEGKTLPTLIAGDFLALDFAPEQFDCAVCFNSVPHFESPGEALHRICRLLAPGGRLAFNCFTPNDVAFGQGDPLGTNRFAYRDTLFTFMIEEEVQAILPDFVTVLRSETRRWQEPDHGTYRTGVHTHEACFFIVERRGPLSDAAEGAF